MAGKAVAQALRLERHSIPEPNSGCFLWMGATIKSGSKLSYGVTAREKPARGQELAHRAAYRLAKGKISYKIQIDHLCQNTLCINPEHLEAVTGPEHRRRTLFRMNGNACKLGHLYTKENTWIEKNGTRHCRRCHADTEARRRARNYERISP